MAFNVNEIGSAVSKLNGLYRNAHYLVNVFPPFGIDTRDLSFLCESAVLPGIHFDTLSVKPTGYGLPELRPHDTVFSPVRCDIMLDNKNYVMDIFHKWMGNIQNFSVDIGKQSDKSNLKYYQVAYPKEFEGTVEIVTYAPTGKTGTELLKYTLNNAFPITIGDISVGWDMHDQYAKLPVTFQYKSFTTSLLPYATNASQTGQSTLALRNLYQSTIQNNPSTTPVVQPSK